MEMQATAVHQCVRQAQEHGSAAVAFGPVGGCTALSISPQDNVHIVPLNPLHSPADVLFVYK